jgi:hypothetical protein
MIRTGGTVALIKRHEARPGANEEVKSAAFKLISSGWRRRLRVHVILVTPGVPVVTINQLNLPKTARTAVTRT